jgi:hypothetical protein
VVERIDAQKAGVKGRSPPCDHPAVPDPLIARGMTPARRVET